LVHTPSATLTCVHRKKENKEGGKQGPLAHPPNRTGSCSSGRNAATTSPSEASPSVTIVNSARVPPLVRRPAIPRSCATTAPTAWHKGVCPPGGSASTASSCDRLAPDGSADLPITTGGIVPWVFSRRISVGNANAAAVRASAVTAAVTSSHRVHFSTVCVVLTVGGMVLCVDVTVAMRLPSVCSIELLLSTRTMRWLMRSLLACSARGKPGGHVAGTSIMLIRHGSFALFFWQFGE